MNAFGFPDRTGTPFVLRGLSLGMRFELQCDEPVLGTRIEELYAACRSDRLGSPGVVIRIERAGTTDAYDVYANRNREAGAVTPDEAIAWCAWLVNSHAVKHSSDLVLHAAAAAHGTRAVVIAGPSGAGKSTLVAALTIAGLDYMGDDSVAVSATCPRVKSNPKPPALDDDALHVLGVFAGNHDKIRRAGGVVGPADLGRALAVDDARDVALVLRPHYRPGPTSLTPLDPAEAAHLLADQSFNFATNGEAALGRVAAIARRARAFHLEFDDLGETVETVLALVGEAAGDTDAIADDRPPARTEDLWVEGVGDAALIWNARTTELNVLTSTATTIWRLASAGLDVESIAQSLARDTGCDPAELVPEITACVADLERGNLLR